jgi:hypothetical protein
MSKEIIENLQLSELEEVKGGQAYRDYHCSSGAEKVVIIEVPTEDGSEDSDGAIYS